jgi:hypothetical protein
LGLLKDRLDQFGVLVAFDHLPRWPQPSPQAAHQISQHSHSEPFEGF